MLAFIGSLGLPELLVIGAIALLIFGSRLPSTMRSLGQSVVQFKKGLKEGESEEGDEPADKGKDKAKDAGAKKEEAPAGKTETK